MPGKPIKTRAPKKVYRGERGADRGPDHIFNEGFEAKDGTATLKDYVWYKHPANVVSTSTRRTSAVGFTVDKANGIWDGWMYEIRSPEEGIDVNATLGSQSVFRGEHEMAYVARIDPKYTYRARPYKGLIPSGDWVYNPNFEGKR